jgi:hypothetical protein
MMHWTFLGASLICLFTTVMAEQLPLGVSAHAHTTSRRNMEKFQLKHGHDILDPKGMLELPRPGAAIANYENHGDLAFMVVSQYSFATKK